MMEPTAQHKHDSKASLCKVCGVKANGQSFGFLNCTTCKLLMLCYFRSKKRHSPCNENQQCTINKKTRSKCSCCFLKKCISLGMDPYYSMRKRIFDTPVSNNASRGSSLFPPCKTCSSSVLQSYNEHNELNEDGNKIFSDDESSIFMLSDESSQSTLSDESLLSIFSDESSLYRLSDEFLLDVLSDEKRDDTSTASLFQVAMDTIPIPKQSCEVCGETDARCYYSVTTCDACRTFVSNHVRNKMAHTPCYRNQQCTITVDNRTECPCCRLKKCLAVGIVYKDSIDEEEEPKEWFHLLSCETCDSENIQTINESFEDLKFVFMERKKKRDYSLLFGEESTEFRVREDFIQRRCENENIFKHSESAANDSASAPIPDQILKQSNLHHSESTSFEYTSNCTPYSVTSERFPKRTSRQSSSSPPSESKKKCLVQTAWEIANMEVPDHIESVDSS